MNYILRYAFIALFLWSLCEANYTDINSQNSGERLARIVSIFDKLIPIEERDNFQFEGCCSRKTSETMSWKFANETLKKSLKISIFEIDEDDLDLRIESLVDIRMLVRHIACSSQSFDVKCSPPTPQGNETIINMQWRPSSQCVWGMALPFYEEITDCVAVYRCVLSGNELITVGYEHHNIGDMENVSISDKWKTDQDYWINRFRNLSLSQESYN